MKKNLSKIFLMTGVVLSLGGLLASCSNDDTDKKKPGTDPDPSGNTFVTTDVVTPVRYTESKYIGSADGVSIDVTSPTADNVLFTCEPGKEINAYRVQVYPLASLYNSLLNEMNTAGQSQLAVDACMDYIKELIQNTESTSPGLLISKKTHGEDFASYEFDYMNSDLRVFMIQPNIDYLVVVQAYFDADGKNSGDLCVCHFKSPKKELAGAPEVDLIIQKDFTSYRVTHVPNADCGYFYYLSSNTKEIQQYIDAYGEEMYRALMCNYGARVAADDEENLSFIAADQDPKEHYTATALAVDINGTPVSKLSRQDFDLPILPDVTDEAKCTIDLPHKTGASIFYFNVNMEKACKWAFYTIYTAEEAEKFTTGDQATKDAEARRLFDEGWGVSNSNFTFDRENNKPTGSSDVDEQMGINDIKGDTEYKIVYIAVNYYNQLSPLMITDGFKTKPLVRDQPDASVADIEIKATKASRTSLTLDFSYNSDNTAIYYFQYYVKDDPEYIFPDIADGSMEARLDPTHGWIYWLLDARVGPLLSPWPSVWPSEGVGAQKESIEIAGYQPATRYDYCYVGEDWNGVLGPVKFFSESTITPVGGDNPTLAMSAVKTASYEYDISLKANEDTRQIRHLACSINDADASKLALASLKAKDPDLTYSDYVEAWEEYTMAQGLTSDEIETAQAVTMNGDFMVAMGLAVGGKDAGTPVYSKLATLVFSNGKIQTLEEYLGIKSTSQTVPALKAASRPVVPAIKHTGRRAWEIKKQ